MWAGGTVAARHNYNIMKKTVKDVEKLSASSVKYLKVGLYYLSIPAVVAVGLKTIDIMRWFQPSV